MVNITCLWWNGLIRLWCCTEVGFETIFNRCNISIHTIGSSRHSYLNDLFVDYCNAGIIYMYIGYVSRRIECQKSNAELLISGCAHPWHFAAISVNKMAAMSRQRKRWPVLAINFALLTSDRSPIVVIFAIRVHQQEFPPIFMLQNDMLIARNKNHALL